MVRVAVLAGWEHLLDKENLGGEIDAETQCVGDVVVPLQVFVVDFYDGLAGRGFGWTVEGVEGVVDDLAELAEAVEDCPDVTWLLDLGSSVGACGRWLGIWGTEISRGVTGPYHHPCMEPRAPLPAWRPEEACLGTLGSGKTEGEILS